MNIQARIKGFQYQIFFSEDLQEIEFCDFNINIAPSSCLLIDKKAKFAISKWVSPKRTRSYPFERVYNTLAFSKKIAVIPIIKDEGADGDRDFIQWDTVSLMSLLDVYVVFAYYVKAEKKGNKITSQLFDNQYVIAKIKEIEQYHSSALHWNLNELNANFSKLLSNVKNAYVKIEKNTGVKLHNIEGIETFRKKISTDISEFISFSRKKSAQAQARELVTIQPKESLSTITKSKITITNYLGGKYYFTTDEIELLKTKIRLIEGKHSKNSLLPSKSDIRDGLLKMILYSNLSEIFIDDKKIKGEAVLVLASPHIKGAISSSNTQKVIQKFCENNHFSDLQIVQVQALIAEAKANKFIIQIHYAQ